MIKGKKLKSTQMIEKKSIFHLSECAYQKQFSSSEHKNPNFIRNEIYDPSLFFFL